MGSVLFFLVASCLHWTMLIGVLAMLIMNGLYWLRVCEHFRSGCANPGMVVSLNPMLIAVHTDLTKGYGSYPAIKIFRKNLSTIAGQVPQVGSRVATVALYSPGMNENSPHWANFDPRPVDCATENIAVIHGVMSTFSFEDWQELSHAVSQMRQPFRCGLYLSQQSY